MKIFYTSKFNREYKKLPEAIRLAAKRKEVIFRDNPFTPSLKTHRLKGYLGNYWSFSVNYSYRILFRFEGQETAYFMAIGDHSIYK